MLYVLTEKNSLLNEYNKKTNKAVDRNTIKLFSIEKYCLITNISLDLQSFRFSIIEANMITKGKRGLIKLGKTNIVPYITSNI